MSDDKTLKNLPVRSTRITAVVSVTMVLLLLGVLGVMAVGVHTAVKQIKESMGFVVVMKADTTATAASNTKSLVERIKKGSYSQTVTYISAEQVLDRWQELVGPDEDIRILLDGENPFTAEVDVRVKAQYASTDSLEHIAKDLEQMPGVENVRVSSDMIRSVQGSISNILLLLGGAALLLLIISIILVNNTVRLAIFSRRHTIYTMQLVGATAAFIRRPIVLQKILDGLIAGLLAAIIVALLLIWGETDRGTLRSVFGLAHSWWILALLPVAGMLLCGLTSCLAVDKYLKRSQDEL